MGGAAGLFSSDCLVVAQVHILTVSAREQEGLWKGQKSPEEEVQGKKKLTSKGRNMAHASTQRRRSCLKLHKIDFKRSWVCHLKMGNAKQVQATWSYLCVDPDAAFRAPS